MFHQNKYNPLDKKHTQLYPLVKIAPKNTYIDLQYIVQNIWLYLHHTSNQRTLIVI